MGHWMRCRALASWFEAEDVVLVVGVDEGGRGLESDVRVRLIALDLSEAAERGWWLEQGIEADAIVLDLSYAARLERRDATRELFCSIGGNHLRRIVIDGVDVQTLVGSADWPFDAVVLPYSGAAENKFVPRTLAGAAYFMLPRDWGAAPKRAADKPVRRVLVTMGGSDPHRLTIRALDAAIAVAGRDWSIRVAIGPAFAADLATAIRTKAAVDPRIEPIEAPSSLAPELAVADLAISSTGLTKYELAWAGVPSVQISIDRIHAGLNADFEMEKTAVHLGAQEDVDVMKIALALSALAVDSSSRAAMSRRGQALVDGQGGARVSKAIREMIDARA